MLLAEYWIEQRLLDSRTYKLICCQLTEPVDAGDLFPSLRAFSLSDTISRNEETFDTDEISFKQVTAAFIPR